MTGLATGLCYVGDERDDHVFHLFEETIVKVVVATLLELIKPYVIRICVGILMAGELPHGFDDAFEVGLKRRPVICFFCLEPDVMGLGGESRECGLLAGGHIDEALAIPGEDTDLGLARFVEELVGFRS